jgi:hypothetical protein
MRARSRDVLGRKLLVRVVARAAHAIAIPLSESGASQHCRLSFADEAPCHALDDRVGGVGEEKRGYDLARARVGWRRDGSRATVASNKGMKQTRGGWKRRQHGRRRVPRFGCHPERL